MTASRTAEAAREPWSVHFALISTQTGFALFPIFGKLALTTIPAMVLAALRIVSAALILEALRKTSGQVPPARADRRAVLLCALLGASFNQVLYIVGLSLTTAIDAAILMATIPVFTLFIAVMLRHEAMTPRAVVSVLLSGAGALLLLHAQDFDWHSHHVQGNLLLIGNAVSYSFYLVLSRPILSRYGALTVVSRVFLYGAVPIVLVAAPALSRFAPHRVTALSWGSLVSVVAFCTIMPYLANSWALARTHASRVALYVFLQPLITSVLAIPVLHESLPGKTVLAAALILGGLAVSVARGRLPARSLP